MLKKAFTLIELLVVIAIIAILAAILFPVFAQAKDAAKDTANLSNLKQQGLAVIQYLTDFDDNFPLSGQYTNTTVNYPGAIALNGSQMPGVMCYSTWNIDTQPYIKAKGIFIHPKIDPPADQSVARRFYYSQGYGAASTPGTWFTGITNWAYAHTVGTGGILVNFDGIMGAGANNGSNVSGWVFADHSLTQTQVETISDDVMVCEASYFDWGLVPASSPSAALRIPGSNGNYFTGVDGLYNTLKTKPGPTARKRVDTNLTGVYPSTATEANALLPKGLTSYCACDGSAKAVDYRGRMLERVQGSSGTWYFKRMSSYIR